MLAVTQGAVSNVAFDHQAFDKVPDVLALVTAVKDILGAGDTSEKRLKNSDKYGSMK